ncbi:hypothetical protein HK101_006530 [Irineochytrium annulatum]|nr:hypothetical protein HK101_006530 [Irineochytrium annulatum]
MNIIAKIRRDESMMREELSREREDDGDVVNRDTELEDLDEFVVPTTNARATTFSAISTVYQYCFHLPHDTYTEVRPEFTLGPSMLGGAEFGVGWVASILLPSMVAKKIRVITGKVRTRKGSAKRSAALEAVRCLYFAKELDEFLKPVKRGSIPGVKHTAAELDTLDAVDGIKSGPVKNLKQTTTEEQSVTEYPIGVPVCMKDGWGNDGWLLLLQVEESDGTERILDLGLLLPSMPSEEGLQVFTLLVAEESRHVSVHPCRKPVVINDRLDLLARYQHVLYSALLRQEMISETSSWSYMTVPLMENGEIGLVHLKEGKDPEDIVDWSALMAVSISSWASGSQYGDYSHNFRDLFGQMGQELIVGDRAYYDRKYKVLDVLTDADPFSTPIAGFPHVAEFYKMRLKITEEVTEKQPLILAIALPHIYQPGKSQEVTTSGPVYLIPQFCAPFPIPASLITRSALILPLIIRLMNHRFLTLDLRSALQLEEFVTPIQFQTALTAPSARWVYDYERLEFLGDAFLKLHVSLHVFVHHPDKNEGWMTRTRRIVERNSTLKRKGEGLSFPEATSVDALSRKTWALPEITKNQNQKISDKCVADTVEAIIGACITCSYVTGGATCIRRLFGDVYEVEWANYVRMYWESTKAHSDCVLSVENKELQRLQLNLVKKLESKIGYSFKNPTLAFEALTHTSGIGLHGFSRCYQRLEFLGDAVLGFIVANHLFIRPEDFSPSKLTDLRSELVNNQFLAIASYDIGLHKLLMHSSSALAASLAAFGQQIEAVRQGRTKLAADHTMDACASDDVDHSALIDAPKAVSDVLEALIGAVTVDSDGDLTAASKVIETVIIRPWWKLFIAASDGDGGFANIQNPVKELYVAATSLIGSGVEHSKRSAKREAAKIALPRLKELLDPQHGGDPLCDCKLRDTTIKGLLEEAGGAANIIGKEMEMEIIRAVNTSAINIVENGILLKTKLVICDEDGTSDVEMPPAKKRYYDQSP